MDSTLHYTSVTHAGSLIACVNKLRVNAELCDVTVVVGDFRILAHKIILSASSPFFNQMLKIDTRQKTLNNNEVSLDSVDEIAALKIIEFCYTSAISLDDDTVWPLFEAAIKFQIPEISCLCCDFLTAGLDSSNCIVCLKLAARLHFSQLEENCIKFLVDNLQKASKSESLVSLSAQDLSSMVSILDAHKISLHVTATLAQAWLNFDPKSRADFVPKLKLLLPALGEIIEKSFNEKASTIPDQGVLSSADTEDECINKDENQTQRDQNESSKGHGPPASHHSSVLNRDLERNANCLKSIGSPLFRTSPGDSKSKIAINIETSSSGIEQSNVVRSIDFICVSCGDEFECESDLDIHGRLCNESVQTLKVRNGKCVNTLSSEVTSHEESQSKCENISQCEEKVVSDCLNVHDSSNPEEDDQYNALSEPSYPKTRRSLRSRKLEEKRVDSAKEKPSICNGDSLLDMRKDGEDNHDLDSKSVGSGEVNNQSDFYGDKEKENMKMDGNLEEKLITGGSDSEAKKDSSSDQGATQLQETALEQASSINDNNNNDVLLSNGSNDQETEDSCTKIDKSNTGISNDGIALTRDTPVQQNSSSSSINKEDQSKQKVSDTIFKGESLDNKGPAALRQWRQENENDSINSFPKSPPRHKCLICSRAFWDRKALANHWKENHGVRSVTNEVEEYSWSDHETEQRPFSGSKRKSPRPSHFLSKHAASSLNNSGSKMNHSTNTQGDCEARSSFSKKPNTSRMNDLPGGQLNSELSMLSVKQEVFEGNSETECTESFANLRKYNDHGHSTPLKSSKTGQSQTSLNQPSHLESINSDPSQTLEHWKRGSFWPQENSENAAHGTEVHSGPNVSQTLNAATSEFITNYINQYSKLAEYCMAQGAQFCSACMGYHPLGIACPNSAPQNTTDRNGDRNKTEYSAKNKETKETEKRHKGNEAEDAPLDMSKSSVDFSLGQMSHSASSSTSRSSSSMNSSGYSSILGVPPFFNYSHLIDSDALDMSVSRYSDGKLTPQQVRDLALPLGSKKKSSPPDPSASSFTPASFPAAFHHHQHPQFSAAAPTGLPSPIGGTSGPSNNGSISSTPSLSNPMSSSHPKSSTSLGGRKKVTSRQGFPCTVCNRVFSYQTALFTHMHTHSPSARTYRCQLCNVTFARAPDLKVHVCPNGLEKPYSCPSCGQTFAKNIHLKRHLATHSGLKPYPCYVCGKRFSRSDHLKRHIQSIHAGARPHVCQVCGKEFVRKYELNKHMLSHEPNFMVTS